MAQPNYTVREGYVAKYVFTWSQHSSKNQAPDTTTLDGSSMTTADTVIYAAGAKNITAIIDATPGDNEEAGDINFIVGTGLGGTFEDGATGIWAEYNYTDAKVEAYSITPTPFLKIRNDNTSGNVAPVVTVLVSW
jgi:hypothetical protein